MLTLKKDNRNIPQALPAGVLYSSYRIKPPLVKPSKLTGKDKGGNGKDLGDGWAVNFAIGCTHGCIFCYVDSINKRYKRDTEVRSIIGAKWGSYFAVPSNLEEAIRETPWHRWRGKEVLMSSMHDPYLPLLYKWARLILEKALANSVRILIQTRSHLVEKDVDLITRHKNKVRVQMSIATYNEKFSQLIEPRAPPPKRRIRTLKTFSRLGVKTGAIIAPIFPPNPYNPNVEADLDSIMRELSKAGVERVYGESLHPRGLNMAYIREALGYPLNIKGWDERAEKMFYKKLDEYGLKGEWWPERY